MINLLESKMNEKGVVEMISTVLLIAIAAVLATIIFLWANSFIVDLGPIGQSCEEVNFEAGIFCDAGNCLLDILNRGNVPIHGIEIKELSKGSVIVKETLINTIKIGDSATVTLSVGEQDYENEEFLIVPIILEESLEKKEFYTCPDRYGFEVFV